MSRRRRAAVEGTRVRLGWDPRTLGMLAVLAALWIGLDRASDGVFLSARNLTNLAVQSSVVAMMATGMVWVIVARHIDLSVGSVLGFAGMLAAVLQVEELAGVGPWPWPVAALFAVAVGAGVGAWQGYWVAWQRLPAFVVTLAGLLMFRGAAFLVTDGRTVAPLAPGFERIGGGLEGAIGAAWSWALGLAAITATGLGLWRARNGRRRHGIPVRPVWAEWCTGLALGAAIAGFVAVMNAHVHPRTGVARGVPIPVLIAIAVALGMGFLTRATRFGRYVFAMGGSPEAAALAGIDVRRTTLGVFAMAGALAGLGGVITSARLGAGANSMGTLAELSVIAAAVIGGTSLAGGAGSIGGAVLGAVVMQSLENGMVLLGVSSPMRQVWIGLILIAAVWIDTAQRRSAR